MLMQVLLFLFLFIGLTGVGLDLQLRLAKIPLAHEIDSALENGSDDATENARTAIAAQIAGQMSQNVASPAPLTAPQLITKPMPLCVAGAMPCGTTLSERFTLQLPAIVAIQAKTAPSACPSRVAAGAMLGTMCNVNGVSAVGEAHLHVIIDVAVRDGTGQLLGSTEREIVLRTLHTNPYAVMIGSRERGSLVPFEVPGDTAGVAPQAGDLASPDPEQPNRYGDTLIHSYAPCRNVPAGAAVSPVENRSWGTWQGNPGGPARELPCSPSSGETSSFQDQTQALVLPTPGWAL